MGIRTGAVKSLGRTLSSYIETAAEIPSDTWPAGFIVFVQQACQVSLGYLQIRPHN